MGIGDWGLGIGDWGLGPMPNPQSPIPNPQSPLILRKIIYYSFKNKQNKINLLFYLKKCLHIIISFHTNFSFF